RAAVSPSASAPDRAVGARAGVALSRRDLFHRWSRGAAFDLGRCPPRTRPADPVGFAEGASAQRRPRPQLPAAAPSVSLGRCRGHLRPARQRLRERTRRAQRAHRPAIGRQRLLERARGGSAEDELMAHRARGRGQVPVRGTPRSREGAGGADGGGASASTFVCLGAIGREDLREVYAAGDVLVVPSIATRTFREPWGLVVNEAMNRGLAVIATDAVGAAAGGLVRDGQSGLIVPAGDPLALA